ncbi:MAG TPA: hypothetical protein VNK91_14355 [Burkholderiaceae bacterium]|jgi:hypothetical protein|nr:hypothetical protein [Burkholderiaceae bacterium]
MRSQSHAVFAALIFCGWISACAAQSVGHLNVPAAQMVRSDFAATSGTAQPLHLLNVVRPNGVYDTLAKDYLDRQTLVLTDFTFIVFRSNGAAYAYPEFGEIYVAAVDIAQRGRPVADQQILARYTIPANESRIVVRVSIGAGRAFSGAHWPAIAHYGPPGVEINARANGYLLGN